MQVLEVLAREGAQSLADLHRATGLPKSTLRRILATLNTRRVVRRSLADQRYRTIVMFPHLSTDMPPAGLMDLAEIGIPHALELTEQIGWPSDIHIREPRYMRIIDSTRPASPFQIYRSRINLKLNLFKSAAGLACLAALPEPEMIKAIDLVEHDAQWGVHRAGLTRDRLLKQLCQIRRQGYAPRPHGYRDDTNTDDQLRAMAVPILRDTIAIGALTVLWPRSFAATDQFAQTHLPVLRDCAEIISDELTALPPI